MSDFSDFSFADNPDPRCPVVLVLDCSGSMGESNGDGPTPIQALSEGLEVLHKELAADELASRRVEVAVVTLGMDVTLVQDFSTVDAWVPPVLVANGPTPLGAALDLALDTLEERKKTYRANGVTYYRPWVLCITDGTPTDDTTKAAARMKEAEAQKSLAFFAIGIEGADMSVLATLGSRTPLRLSGMKFGELFVWLSASQARVSSSRPGDTVALPAPDGWAEV